MRFVVRVRHRGPVFEPQSRLTRRSRRSTVKLRRTRDPNSAPSCVRSNIAPPPAFDWVFGVVVWFEKLADLSTGLPAVRTQTAPATGQN